MPDELDFQAQPENQVETEMSLALHEERGSERSVGETLLEVVDPVEGFFEAFFEDPRWSVALLVIIVVGAPIVLVGWGLWAAIQEAFIGGPPQGLGLK